MCCGKIYAYSCRGPHATVRASLGKVIEKTGDRRLRSNPLDETELSERRDAIVETDFLDDLAILQTQDRGAGEVDLAPGSRRQ